MTDYDDTIRAYIRWRNEALSRLDMKWARSMVPPGQHLDDAQLLLGMHKARYDCVGIDPALRHESAEFLRAGGYGATNGPLLPPGQLP